MLIYFLLRSGPRLQHPPAPRHQETNPASPQHPPSWRRVSGDPFILDTGHWLVQSDHVIWTLTRVPSDNGLWLVMYGDLDTILASDWDWLLWKCLMITKIIQIHEQEYILFYLHNLTPLNFMRLFSPDLKSAAAACSWGVKRQYSPLLRQRRLIWRIASRKIGVWTFS